MLLKETSSFTLAPAGQFRAVCVDFVDLGLVVETYDEQPRQTHKCRVVYEIDEVNGETGKRFTIGRRFTVSLNEKANLRKFLEQWRGKPFTADELKGFDTENLIGVNALIQIAHVTKGDKTYDNITSIMGLPRGMQKIAASSDYIRVKDRAPTNGNGGPPAHHNELPPDDDGYEPVPF